MEVEVRDICLILFVYPDGVEQRHKLGSNLTPVTPETFAVWKKTRMDKKEAELEASRKTKELQNSAGKSSGMSGRDLVRRHFFVGSNFVTHCVIFFFLQFQYNPEWFQDEEDGDASDDWDLAKYRREQEEDNLAAEELRIANLALQNGNYEETTEGSAGGGD